MSPHGCMFHDFSKSNKDDTVTKADVLPDVFGAVPVGDLHIKPSYNPFWVLEGTQFSATCVKEDSTRVPLVWNVNGIDPQSMASRGYNIKYSVVRMERNLVRSSSQLTKEMTVADADEFGPAFVVCETVAETEDQKEQMFISVHLFSVFTEHPNITEGEDVSLKCSPDYEDSIVIWSRDGQLIDSGSGRYVLEDQNRTLVIRNSRPQDAGVYQCSMRIPAGLTLDTLEPLQQTFTKNIHVSGKPYLQKDAPSRVDGSVNSSVALTCPVAAFPLPKVYWLRGDDSPVEPSSRVAYANYNGVTGAKLTISSMTKQDFGVYECVAENSVGRLVKEFKVAVAGGSSLLAGVDNLARVLLLAVCACLVAFRHEF
ncbi:hypothetical protein ACOMHN_018562 [Nucella lapillus]